MKTKDRQLPKIRFKKLSLCDYNVSLFIKQIDVDEFYLVKYSDRWFAGQFSSPDDEDDSENGFAWHFDLGAFETQLSSRRENLLDDDFEEVYHIIDPAHLAKRAKTLLRK
jgi:hypothetical protein